MQGSEVRGHTGARANQKAEFLLEPRSLFVQQTDLFAAFSGEQREEEI